MIKRAMRVGQAALLIGAVVGVSRAADLQRARAGRRRRDAARLWLAPPRCRALPRAPTPCAGTSTHTPQLHYSIL
jgi:hypothetical protein